MLLRWAPCTVQLLSWQTGALPRQPDTAHGVLCPRVDNSGARLTPRGLATRIRPGLETLTWNHTLTSPSLVPTGPPLPLPNPVHPNPHLGLCSAAACRASLPSQVVLTTAYEVGVLLREIFWALCILHTVRGYEAAGPGFAPCSPMSGADTLYLLGYPFCLLWQHMAGTYFHIPLSVSVFYNHIFVTGITWCNCVRMYVCALESRKPVRTKSSHKSDSHGKSVGGLNG